MQYAQVKKGNVPKYSDDHIVTMNPGRITNEVLLKTFTKYIRDDNEVDPTNFILNRKAFSAYQYKLIPKECWDIV